MTRMTGAPRPTGTPASDRLRRMGLLAGVVGGLAALAIAVTVFYTPPEPEPVSAEAPQEGQAAPDPDPDPAPAPDPEPVEDAAPPPFELIVPVACTVGTDCFLQHYPDWTTGEGREDYMCGTQTYDGHDGTDIRLKDLHMMAAGVPVVAAAPGIVVGLRDGEDDAIVMTDERRAAVEGKDCGNGVVIAHGQGWRTQYCHLREGSVNVLENQRVTRGQPLGLVGSSGASEFPHLEFILRRGEDVVDPFVGAVPAGGCGQPRDPLWTADAQEVLTYERSAVISVGFADGPLSLVDAEAPKPPPGLTAPALVAYGHVINIEAGDVLEVTLDGPEGRIADNGGLLEEPEARRLIFTGRRRAPGVEAWPPGRYVARVTISRDGETAVLKEAVLDLSAEDAAGPSGTP